MTPNILAQCTGARIDRAQTFAPFISTALAVYSITTPVRQAAFLANVGVESGGLHWLTELWGPTAQQSRYEGRADLGNVHPGDGARFKGHGLLQVTGRANHARARDRLRARFPDWEVPDFEAEPEKLALPEWAALSAGDYWDDHKINAFADAGDFDGCCDLVNRGHKTERIGDANGYVERLALYNIALQVLS
jgi:putative chitinase